ncbi:MAG TPA: DUF3307 domain-containing protein [Clostridia bacterium]|nr:DUF3307 domain-containing protein [Clostridia bacterium]
MYSEVIISLLLLSHVLGDFYFQTGHIALNKGKNPRIMLKHTLHFSISAFVLTSAFLSWELSIVIAVLSVSHYILDGTKIKLNKKYGQLPNIFYFMADQIIHILAILFIYPLIAGAAIHPWSSYAIAYLSARYPLLGGITYNSLTYFILASAFLLYLANAGTFITKLFLELPSFLADKKTAENASSAVHPELSGGQEAAAADTGEPSLQMYKYGEVIGILERIIIFMLIVSGHYEGIALVIAAKSIARFKQFERHAFSDYYLVGTLASFLIAIAGGELFMAVCRILEL